MSITTQAIQSVMNARLSFCKFFSANDTGETGGHQSGIYIPKPAVPILFDSPGVKGENKSRWVKIKWQNDFTTDARFIYYGQGSRNEYRITHFGRGFTFLNPTYTGALFILAGTYEDFYHGYILNSEDEIDAFLGAFGLTPAETNQLIETGKVDAGVREEMAINEFIGGLKEEFPTSDVMSSAARNVVYAVGRNKNLAVSDPDSALLKWTEEEYKIFRELEHARYGGIIQEGFSSVDEFVALANRVLNRRKSRAGKSLEHHLAAIFDQNHIEYTAQAITEGRKKPDFIFPSEAAYHDFSFPLEKLTSLAAKTTCKDRWRQILNEADRLRDGRKYLCTLQQGISSAQMDEMEQEKVTLVVPAKYIKTYPRSRQPRIWTIEHFVDYVKELQND